MNQIFPLLFLSKTTHFCINPYFTQFSVLFPFEIICYVSKLSQNLQFAQMQSRLKEIHQTRNFNCLWKKHWDYVFENWIKKSFIIIEIVIRKTKEKMSRKMNALFYWWVQSLDLQIRFINSKRLIFVTLIFSFVLIFCCWSL